MGKHLELKAADGHTLAAYLAEPAGKPRGAVIVIQEIFGVNSHIRAVADGYAADGYLAIAPALFDRAQRGVEYGYTPEDIQKGFALKNASDIDHALKDVAAALAQVSHAGKVGIVGYCWGGYVSWMAACRLDGLACAAPYYGGGTTTAEAIAERPKCAVMSHYADRDMHIPMDGVQQFTAAHPEVTVHVYAADHGFNCDQRGSWDAAAAKLARSRTLAFFQAQIG